MKKSAPKLAQKFYFKIDDRYIQRERERDINRKFGVNGFEFYEVFLDLRTLKNKM